MAGFAAVDNAPDPDWFVRFLDDAAVAESGMKHYMAAAHAIRRPRGPILDIGCGAGHDLALFARYHLTAVGVEPSAVLLDAAKARAIQQGVSLVQGRGEELPFTDGAFSGCRIERVLMHVNEPRTVINEALRCIQPGGLITVFEPDWGQLEIASDVLSGPATWITTVAHPEIGAQLWGLLEQSGGEVLDRVEERSLWRSLATLERVCGFPSSVDRAVALGRISPGTAEQWIEEQRERNERGKFRATLPKVLLVARKR